MPSWRLKNPGALVDGWDFNGHVASMLGRYPGTAVNTPNYAAGPQGRQCIELDGNTQHVNVGDVTQLNAVSAFTICWWMNQDVVPSNDTIFVKLVACLNRFQVFIIGTTMYHSIADGVAQRGRWDYTTRVSAAHWHHFAEVYDGSQTGDAYRLMLYVDGVPVTFAGFDGIIPAITPDWTGADLYIGDTANSFGGKLYDVHIYSVPLSRDEIREIIDAPVPFAA